MFQVLRDGKWKEEDAVSLVPGDIVSIKLGDIVPSDARLLEGDALKIDQVLCLLFTTNLNSTNHSPGSYHLHCFAVCSDWRITSSDQEPW